MPVKFQFHIATPMKLLVCYQYFLLILYTIGHQRVHNLIEGISLHHLLGKLWGMPFPLPAKKTVHEPFVQPIH